MNKIKGTPLSAKLALISACLFWAGSFIAVKVALESTPPLTMVMFRLLISALCFLIWGLFSRIQISILGWRWFGWIVALSLFGTGLHYSIQTIGIQFTTAANASLYTVTGPISIAIIAAIFLKEKVTKKKILGIGFALLGVLVVLGLDTILSFKLEGRMVGDLLVFASIFMWGIFTVLGKKMTQQMDALSMTAAITFLGALIMIPAGWIEMKSQSFALSSIGLNSWLSIAFLGVFCSFMATLFYVYALGKTESQKVGVYLYTIPPITYALAAIFLGETIGLSLLIGSVLVLTGVFLTERG